MPVADRGFETLFACEHDSPLEAARRDLGSFPMGRRGEAQLLSSHGVGSAWLRPLRAECVRYRPRDGHHVEVRDRGGRHYHLDLAALAFDLNHAATPQLALEADVARDRLELAALHAGAAALPPRGAHDDPAA